MSRFVDCPEVPICQQIYSHQSAWLTSRSPNTQDDCDEVRGAVLAIVCQGTDKGHTYQLRDTQGRTKEPEVKVCTVFRWHNPPVVLTSSTFPKLEISETTRHREATWHHMACHPKQSERRQTTTSTPSNTKHTCRPYHKETPAKIERKFGEIHWLIDIHRIFSAPVKRCLVWRLREIISHHVVRIGQINLNRVA